MSVVFAIFGLIGLGYAAARTGVLAAKVGEGLTEFVFRLAIPVLLFRTLATADLHGLSPWRIWAAYFAALAIVWFVGHQAIRRIFGRDARAGVVAGVSASYSNAALIGVPLMHAAFGEAGTVFLIVIISVHLPVMMVASVLLNEWALKSDHTAVLPPSRGVAARRVLRHLARHPILHGIVAGLLWRLGGIPLPALGDAILQPLATAAGPLALFASGMALQNYGIARQTGPATVMAALKLLVMPALVFAAANALGLPPLGVAVLTLTAACPTGVNAYLTASQLGTGQALASNTLLFSTAGGVVTVTLWLAVLQATLR
jgi:predicted permease